VRGWHWSAAKGEQEHLASELKEALVSHGLPWLDRLSGPRQLAAALEAEKCFTQETDATVAEVMRALGTVTVTAYQSPGFLTPRAGKLRPNIVKALSFCYEVGGEWDLAIRAWEEYASVVQDRLPNDPALAVQLGERRAFLETQRRIVNDR
jgi:hypothetical protein